MLAGDIHFAYVATIDVGGGVRVRQVVSSPMRNALATVERSAIRFASGRAGTVVGGLLARLAGRGARRHRFQLDEGPYFNNNIGLLEFPSATEGRVRVERSRLVDDEPDLETVIDLAL